MPPGSIEPRVVNALLSAFGNLDAYLRNIIKELHTEDGIILRDQFNLSRMDSIIRTLRVDMEALGYRQAIRTQLEGLSELHQEALAKMKALKKKGANVPKEFSTESEAAIRMLLIGAEQELIAVAETAASTMGQVLRRSTMGNTDFSDLLIELQDLMGKTKQSALTLARTTLHSFNSMITVQYAEEAEIDWFVYMGPDDDITRIWCNHWVGLRGTLNMFQKTSHQWGRQKQPNPVSAWRGGWNCRHRLVPVFGDDLKKYKIGPRTKP
jgi:hypothetical protein